MQTRKTIANYVGALLGAFLFTIAINIVIVPHGLYSGTLTGVAQAAESMLVDFAGVTMPGFNLTGIMLLLFNIPLLILVLGYTDRSFPVKSIICIIFQTTTMAIVPIPEVPLVHDPLTAAIVGGALAGFGAGFTLRCGGSGGGTDLIGVYCSVKYPNFTVGKVTLIFSAFVYAYALIRFDLNIVIYSIIFTTLYAFALDNSHSQNIKSNALIFTTNPDAVHIVMEKLYRGATCWEGKGAYSGQRTHIFMTVISKYEVSHLKRIIKEVDPRAFIIINDKVEVSGNFIKKL